MTDDILQSAAQFENTRQELIDAIPIETLAEAAAFDPQLFFSLTMPETFYKPFSAFHLSMLDVVSGNQLTGQRACRVGPRGWGKSTTITEGGSLYIACRNSYLPKSKQYRFILIVSETTAQAEARLATIKSNLTSNEMIEKYYPDAFGMGPIWRTDYILTSNDICISAVGINSSVRGIKYKDRRPDLIIGDDMDSLSTAGSPILAKGIEEAFTRDLLKCGHDQTDILVVGTIVSKICLCYKLLYSDDYSGWDGKLFAALHSFPSRMDLWDSFGDTLRNRQDRDRKENALALYMRNREEMDIGGVSGWPAVYSVYNLMCEYYTDGRKVFLTEKQNQVSETGDAYFQPEKYKYVDEDEFAAIMQYNPLIFMYVDPTGGESASSKTALTTRGPDKFAITLLGKVDNDQIVLVDFEARQLRQSQQFTVIGKMLSKWPVYRLLVEGNAGQTHYVSALKKFLGNLYADDDWLMQAKTNSFVFPRTIMNSVNKEERISSLEPHLDNGTLVLRAEMLLGRGTFKELHDELSDWPHSAWDDGLDSLSGCFFSAYRTFKFASLYHGG